MPQLLLALGQPTQTPTPLQSAMADQGGSAGSTWELLLLVVFLIVLLIAVYYATRFFARVGQRGSLFKGGSRSTFRPGAHIALVDRLVFDKDKSVALVKCEDGYYLLGIGGESITLLKELDKALIPDADGIEQAQQQACKPTSATFKDVLANFKKPGGGQGGQL